MSSSERLNSKPRRRSLSLSSSSIEDVDVRVLSPGELKFAKADDVFSDDRESVKQDDSSLETPKSEKGAFVFPRSPSEQDLSDTDQLSPSSTVAEPSDDDQYQSFFTTDAETKSILDYRCAGDADGLKNSQTKFFPGQHDLVLDREMATRHPSRSAVLRHQTLLSALDPKSPGVEVREEFATSKEVVHKPVSWVSSEVLCACACLAFFVEVQLTYVTSILSTTIFFCNPSQFNPRFNTFKFGAHLKIS